jgi:hypothetical protein
MPPVTIAAISIPRSRWNWARKSNRCSIPAGGTHRIGQVKAEAFHPFVALSYVLNIGKDCYPIKVGLHEDWS